MGLAEELLNSVNNATIEHTHDVPDSDAHFTIDPYTREIVNVNYNKTVLMRGDHNSERFTFELPRYVDGHDMSLCNRVIVHFDNVGDSIENVHSDVAYMEDLRINPNNSETVISSWLIRREATQIVGILSFSLQYQCVEEGEITYEWNTDSYDEIEIRKSKQNGQAAVINYTNVLEEWRSQIFGAGDSVMANISAEGATQVTAVQTESATQQAAIELKGSETLASIPEDYTEVYNMASEAVRTKADGVICEVEGDSIVVTDTSDDYIRGLNVYGRSTQAITTGSQKLPYPYTQTTRTTNGITYTDNGDGSITISGTATANAYFDMFNAPSPEIPGVHFLSGAPSGVDCKFYAYTGGAYKEERGTGVVLADGVTSVHIVVAAGTTINTTVYPMLNEGESALPWEPYSGGIASPNPDYPQEIENVENTDVEIFGGNLFDDSSLVGQEVLSIHGNMPLKLPKGDYHVDVALDGDISEKDVTMVFYDSNKQRLVEVNTLKDSVFTLPEFAETVNIYPFSGAIGGRWISLMIHAGSSEIEYEPYKESQSIVIPRMLNGIPVTSGGNYTDSNGQQWICDEIDFERGVYVQRVKKTKLENMSVYDETKLLFQKTLATDMVNAYNVIQSTGRSFVTHYSYSEGIWNGTTIENGYVFNYRGIFVRDLRYSSLEEYNAYLAENEVYVVYELEIPIETPLTADEIETYKSIKTNYPNTTILNDSGAMMKVKYNADTKLYISNAVEAGVVNVVEGVLNDTY